MRRSSRAFSFCLRFLRRVSGTSIAWQDNEHSKNAGKKKTETDRSTRDAGLQGVRKFWECCAKGTYVVEGAIGNLEGDEEIGVPDVVCSQCGCNCTVWLSYSLNHMILCWICTQLRMPSNMFTGLSFLFYKVKVIYDCRYTRWPTPSTCRMIGQRVQRLVYDTRDDGSLKGGTSSMW